MKNLIIASLLCLVTVAVNAQDNNQRYLAGYKYIIENTKLTDDLIVSDSVQPIKLVFFLAGLSKEWRTSQKEAYSRLLIEMGTSLPAAYNPYIAKFNKPARLPKYIAFFSDIKYNKLTVEIFQLKSGTKSLNYDSISTFNASTNYLFIFNNSKIKKVYKTYIK
jgi:hypothetical protein